MGKCRGIENNQQYKTLIANGVSRKVAKELQKLHSYCNFRGMEIVNSENCPANVSESVLYVATKKSQAAAMRLLNGRKKVAVAVVKDRGRNAGSDYVTISRRSYTLYVKDNGLQPQVFKL